MNKDYIEKFTGIADIYEDGRPLYHRDILPRILSECKLNESSVIVDVGAGNGLLTSMLVYLPHKIIYGVEPNDDMRRVFCNKFPASSSVKAIDSTAEDLSMFADNSVDVITVGQALHWFNVEKFHKECNRILKKDGKLILVYNSRKTSSKFAQNMILFLRTMCPKFSSYTGGLNFAESWRDILFERCIVEYIDRPQFFDKEEWVNRNLSSSYTLRPGDTGYEKMIRGFRELFDEYNKDGIIELENNTVLYIGTLRKPNYPS